MIITNKSDSHKWFWMRMIVDRNDWFLLMMIKENFWQIFVFVVRSHFSYIKHKKIVLKILKRFSNDFHAHISIFMFIVWLLLVITDNDWFLLINIDDYLWLLMFIDDYWLLIVSVVCINRG